MSRIGKLPINLPNGVNVTVADGVVKVQSSKGNLEQAVLSGIKVNVDDSVVNVTRDSDEALHRGNHGLMRTLVANMVEGVDSGFEKKLELNGVGYRVAMQGSDLKLNVGYSHDVIYKVPAGTAVSVDQNIITISGINKQQVGQVSAEIRAVKKPEPYKGKGIKYVGERIIRKSGKSGKDKA